MVDYTSEPDANRSELEAVGKKLSQRLGTLRDNFLQLEEDFLCSDQIGSSRQEIIEIWHNKEVTAMNSGGVQSS